MNDQVGGVLRALGPLVVGVLVGWGIDSTTAGLVTTALGGVAAAGWSYYENSLARKAKALAATTGVRVEVSRQGPPELKELVDDTSQPNIVARTP